MKVVIYIDSVSDNEVVDTAVRRRLGGREAQGGTVTPERLAAIQKDADFAVRPKEWGIIRELLEELEQRTGALSKRDARESELLDDVHQLEQRCERLYQERYDALLAVEQVHELEQALASLVQWADDVADGYDMRVEAIEEARALL